MNKTELKNEGMPELIAETVAGRILIIRNTRVLLDSDLAELYGVETKRLLEAVKRNIDRFPEDFMFQLSQEEFDVLRSQFATSKKKGGRRYLPYVFTEQGVAMLSSVLRSKRAVQVNIAIMRAFVKLRQLLNAHQELAEKLNAMEQKYDEQFRIVFDAIRELMMPLETKSKRPIGYIWEEDS